MLSKLFIGKLIECFYKLAINYPKFFDKDTHKRINKAYVCFSKIKVQMDKELNSDKVAKPMYTCKSRLCFMCERYKGVKTLLKYAPAFQKMYEHHLQRPQDNPTLYFVTLTRPLTDAENIRDVAKLMGKAWSSILKMSKHLKLKYFIGIRKLEVTYKLKRLACNTATCKRCKKGQECTRGKQIIPVDHHSYNYHLHYHLIIRYRPNAHYLVNEWLKRFPESSREAQSIRSFGGIKWCKKTKSWVKRYSKNFKDGEPNVFGAMFEVLKYIIKPPFSKAKKRNRFGKVLPDKDALNLPKIPAEALPYIHINEQLQNIKTIFAFGGLKQATEDEQKEFLEAFRPATEQALDDIITQKTNEEAYRVDQSLSCGVYSSRSCSTSKGHRLVNFVNEKTGEMLLNEDNLKKVTPLVRLEFAKRYLLFQAHNKQIIHGGIADLEIEKVAIALHKNMMNGKTRKAKEYRENYYKELANRRKLSEDKINAYFKSK